MSSRVLACRLAAALLFFGLAFGAAPAQAQYGGCGYGHCYGAVAPVRAHWWGCGACGTSYVAPRLSYYYAGGCGACGTRYIVPQPSAYYYSGSCGACGSAYYVVPRPLHTAIVEPEFEQSPIYYGGERIYRRAFHYRHRRVFHSGYRRAFVGHRVRHVVRVHRAAVHRHRVYR